MHCSTLPVANVGVATVVYVVTASVVASLTSGTATSVTKTVLGTGEEDIVSATNTVLGTAVVVVVVAEGVSGTRITLCGA